MDDLDSCSGSSEFVDAFALVVLLLNRCGFKTQPTKTMEGCTLGRCGFDRQPVEFLQTKVIFVLDSAWVGKWHQI